MDTERTHQHRLVGSYTQDSFSSSSSGLSQDRRRSNLSFIAASVDQAVSFPKPILSMVGREVSSIIHSQFFPVCPTNIGGVFITSY
jgi:hypothetical protein